MWHINYYTDNTGKKPVEIYISKLDVKTRAKTYRELGLLEEFGIRLGMPDVKPLGQGLYELRLKGNRKIVRIFHCYAKGKNIYLLHAFTKKTQKTPQKDLLIARKRQKIL